ncbi:MAG0110 family membrane protein [Mycoplasma seminis]|uniref:Bax inhibitor-1/YccA family protein n=1 Tax=Mycoplasma seminis TaxID=512749 RepID=A0ABY9HBN4_9MOLU|nr:hypothetical protein [Mycoplasma seminis]WLP85604.1 hypothetical protein Q8852_00345 [Mycoplasma seminis]
MNSTQKQDFTDVTFEKTSISAKTQFYAIMLLTFIVGLVLMLSLAVGLSFWFSTEHFANFFEQHWIALIIALVVIFLVNFFLTMFIGMFKNPYVKLALFPVFIIFYGIVIALAFFAYFNLASPETMNNMPAMIGIMLIPAGVMVIAAILGLFQLVNIRVMWIFVAFLSVAFLITFFVSFFVYRANWYVTVIGTALISINMIIQWWMIRKTADVAQYMSKRDMLSIAIQEGILLFISYAQLLWYVIMLFVGRRD